MQGHPWRRAVCAHEAPTPSPWPQRAHCCRNALGVISWLRGALRRSAKGRSHSVQAEEHGEDSHGAARSANPVPMAPNAPIAAATRWASSAGSEGRWGAAQKG